MYPTVPLTGLMILFLRMPFKIYFVVVAKSTAQAIVPAANMALNIPHCVHAIHYDVPCYLNELLRSMWTWDGGNDTQYT